VRAADHGQVCRCCFCAAAVRLDTLCLPHCVPRPRQ
jgi:hypothetical protein